jgi:autotransporter-associated beta strand protein
LTMNGGTLSIALTANNGSAIYLPLNLTSAGVTVGGTSASIINAVTVFNNNGINLGTLGATTVPFTVNTTGAAGPDLTVSAVLANAINVANNGLSASGLIKAGAGTMLLTGADVYSGQTTVSNGELIISTVFAGKGNFVVNDGVLLGVTNLSATSASISNLILGVSGPTTLEFQKVSSPTTALISASNLTLNGSCTVKITGTNNLVVGNTYPLINYSGNLTGSFAGFRLQMPAGLAGVLVNNAHQLALSVMALPTTPTNLTATAGDAQAILNWNIASNATGYNVKRSTTSGGSYTSIANNFAATDFTNSGLSNGTAYYYVVSATNAVTVAESGNSVEVAVRPVSATSPTMSAAISSGQLHLNWPQDHTGWALQTQTNSPGTGLGTNWVTVAGSAETNQMVIPVVSTNGSVFLRLVYP